MSNLPTSKNVAAAKAVKKCVCGWAVANRLLDDFFGQYTTVTNLDIVLVKVRLVNNLYATGIQATGKVAEGIVCCSKELQKELKNGDAGAVARIALCARGKIRRSNYSFASKFAHFQNQNEFPIWDGRVQRAITSFTRADGNKFSGWEKGGRQPRTKFDKVRRTYEQYRTEIQEFSRCFDGAHCGSCYRDVDDYLWLKGNKLQKKKQSFEVRHAKKCEPEQWRMI